MIARKVANRRAILAKRIERHLLWSADYARSARTPQPLRDEQGRPKLTDDGVPLMGPSRWEETPWRQRSIADVAALKGIELQQARERCDKLANALPKALGVVVMPAPAASLDDWDRERKAIEAKAISVPALPAKGS